jgi:SAM-dependent methyltransferase
VDRFKQLIDEAAAQPFAGWDFSFLRGRMVEEHPDWDYLARVRLRFAGAHALLDMGTGGGEVLESLAPLPSRTVATEGYVPNVETARRRLSPLGVEVVAVPGVPDNLEIGEGEGIGSLPFPDASFPLVINRHESYFPAEVRRVLEPGGTFITQQVGGTHDQMLNRLLGAAAKEDEDAGWNLTFAVRQLTQAGFRIVDQREAYPATVFRDIGAVAYYLKAIPWQISDFTVDAYRERLLSLHHQIEAEGSLRIPGYLFYVEVMKP